MHYAAQKRSRASTARAYGGRKKRRQNAYRRRAPALRKPSRLYSGRKTFDQTTKVANKVMSNLCESKYAGARQDCLKTVPKPTGTLRPMSYIFVNTGRELGSGYPEWQTPLDLFTFKQGTEGDRRVGEYMYLKHTTLKMEITALPYEADGETSDPYINSPVRCRLMIVKANRKNNKFDSSPIPKDSLFINTQNDQFGYGETTGSINLLMKQPVNKRKWLVYKDTSFTLTPNAIGQTGFGNEVAYSVGGRHSYRCQVKLPTYKKTHFENLNNSPDNVDTQWFVVLQCAREAHCFQSGPGAIRPDNIRMEILGTTAALDN